jgi:peptidoglycan/xylan/chitin deacetylase (PgdA/CDA1 family)
MIWIKIKYRFYLFINTLLFKIGFANRLLKNRYGERIIVFHGINKIGETKYNSRFHSVHFFEKFIQYATTNYNVISLDDFYNQKFKPNTLNIAITFDDGYLNNYEFAVPILEKYAVPTTFFITTNQENTAFLWPDFLDLVSFYTSKSEILFENNWYSKNNKNEFIYRGMSLKNNCKSLSYKEIQPLFTIFEEEWKRIQDQSLNEYWEVMNENQIKQKAENTLFTIGSHSYTHANLAKIPFEEAKFEILKGKEILESFCKKSILEFAFPFGTYNSELVSFCKEIGFNKVLLLDYNSVHDKKDISLKNRFVMNPHVNLNLQLLYLLKGNYY